MKKRILALLFTAAMLLSLCACSDNGASTDATSATEASSEAGAEEVFAKAFEADKNYDIDAMAEVEYSINFSKSADKEERIQKTKDSLKEIDEDSLNSYKQQLASAKYSITETVPLNDDEIKSRIAQLESQYRDTDKITEIIKLSYQVTLSDGEEPVNDNAAEMIKVDGKWYCYMGETTWGD